MEMLYAYRGSDVAELRRTWRDVVRREFYAGELDPESADEFDISAQRSLSHPISLIRTVSRSNMSFRRTQRDIRGSASIRLLLFIRRGELRIVRSEHQCVVGAGQCAILDFDTPSLTQALVGDDGVFETIQAIVPSQVFLSHFAGAADLATPFDIGSDDRHAIARLLDVLFDEGARLSRKAAEPLVAAFLETIADNLESMTGRIGRRIRASDRRLEDIQAYITKNLSDPGLSATKVAQHCGISERYLCHVLKANHTSFSSLLWPQRLGAASDWLLAEGMRDHSVQEIAFMAGFKNAAHFSRMFKAAYGVSPSAHRAETDLKVRSLR